ncbi:MAG: DUF433 domain-containing protein [Candidatus Acidiferrales bacterium]
MPNSELYNEPAYGVPEASTYLKVPYNTLRYWLTGFKRMPPMIEPVETEPVRLSFINLLECHVLAGMRKVYDLKLPKVRSALRKLGENDQLRHPLISQAFLTDRNDLFIERLGKMINVSQHGQMGLNFYRMYLERVEVDPKGMFRFFPFVVQSGPSEPKLIEINPMIGFGKPVIAGTGISTAIIASRFNARESIADLAAEYERPQKEIEEAIRWERALPAAA